MRAAEVLYLHGPSFQEADEGTKYAYVPGGFFVYLTIPRSERVYILQVQAL